MEEIFQARCKVLAISTIIAASGFPISSHAAWQIDTSFNARGDTNARYTEPKQGDTEISGRLNISQNDSSGTTSQNINYSFGKSIYLEETNQDRTEHTGNINLNWAPNSRLSFALDHVASNSLSNSREQDIPDNRRQQSTSQISSRYQIPLNNTNHINFQLSAIYNTLEDSNSDSYRYNFNAAYQRRHTNHWQSSIRLGHNSIEFIDIDNQNYDRQDISYELDYRMARGRITLTLGYNSLSREAGGNVDGSIFGLLWQQNLNGGGILQVNAEKRLTDTSIGLVNASSSTASSSSNSSAGTAIEEASIISLNFEQPLSRQSRFSTRLTYEHNEQQNALREDKTSSITTSILHSFTRHLSGRASLESRKQEQVEINASRTSNEVQFSLQKTISSRLRSGIVLGYSTEKLAPRSNSDTQENTFFELSLSYRLL